MAGELLARLAHAEDRLAEDVALVRPAIDVDERIGREPGRVRIAAGDARPHQAADVVHRPLEDLGHEDRRAQPVRYLGERHRAVVALAERGLQVTPGNAGDHRRLLRPVGVPPAYRVVPLAHHRLAELAPLEAGGVLERVLPVTRAHHDVDLGRGHGAIGREAHVPGPLGAEREVEGVEERLLFELGQHQDKPVGALAAREGVVAGASERPRLPDPARDDDVVDRVVIVHGQAQLLHVADALGTACGLPRRLHRGQQKGDQDGDDGDDDEELDQREGAA